MTDNTQLLAEEHYAKQALEEVSRSFALTIPQLPPPLRAVVTNAYLLCRIVDTIEDEAGLSIDRKQHFFDEFIAVLNGKSSGRDFADNLYPLLTVSATKAEKNLVLNTPSIISMFSRFDQHRQTVMKRCAEVMSSGMLRFQQIRGLNGLPTLLEMTSYCYFVAGCVGEMLTELFCDYSSEIAKRRTELFPLASSFGKGLQMTNILKDMWEDRSQGVCWLPRDIFDGAGLSLSHLEREHSEPPFGIALDQLIGIARFYLKHGVDYSLRIPTYETGIRKFCLWSVGMAIFTLRNIHRNPGYSSAGQVKISRSITRSIISVSNAMIRNNLMLYLLFAMFSWGLPDAPPGRHPIRTVVGQSVNEPTG